MSHQNSYNSSVLIGNWAEERNATEAGIAVCRWARFCDAGSKTGQPRTFSAVTTSRAAYQAPTAVEQAPRRIPPEVDGELLFGHGHDLASRSFATTYDLTHGVGERPQDLTDAPRTINPSRETVRAKMVLISPTCCLPSLCSYRFFCPCLRDRPRRSPPQIDSAPHMLSTSAAGRVPRRRQRCVPGSAIHSARGVGHSHRHSTSRRAPQARAEDDE